MCICGASQVEIAQRRLCWSPNSAAVAGCLVAVSGWPLFSRTKMNVPLIHAKKQRVFCLDFHTNLSCVQGPTATAALCIRGENGHG